MTGTAVVNSDAVLMGGMKYVAIQFVWTGTPTGTFIIQVSNDGGTTWTTVDDLGTISASGAAGNHMVDVITGAKQVRASYTNASSTGTLNAYAQGKE